MGKRRHPLNGSLFFFRNAVVEVRRGRHPTLMIDRCYPASAPVWVRGRKKLREIADSIEAVLMPRNGHRK